MSVEIVMGIALLLIILLMIVGLCRFVYTAVVSDRCVYCDAKPDDPHGQSCPGGW